jgi:hypothetical protein
LLVASLRSFLDDSPFVSKAVEPMLSQPLSSVRLAALDQQEEWGTASFFDPARR